uniref:BZIP domain-containing protein n=1 Tax=Steinernema glaseri TaxID=37863 RepID=A0A1I8AKE6_9BILA
MIRKIQKSGSKSILLIFQTIFAFTFVFLLLQKITCCGVPNDASLTHGATNEIQQWDNENPKVPREEHMAPPMRYSYTGGTLRTRKFREKQKEKMNDLAHENRRLLRQQALYQQQIQLQEVRIRYLEQCLEIEYGISMGYYFPNVHSPQQNPE